MIRNRVWNCSILRGVTTGLTCALFAGVAVWGSITTCYTLDDNGSCGPAVNDWYSPKSGCPCAGQNNMVVTSVSGDKAKRCTKVDSGGQVSCNEDSGSCSATVYYTCRGQASSCNDTFHPNKLGGLSC